MQFESFSSSVLSLLCGPALTSVHKSWKNHSFNCKDLCQQNDISAFQGAVKICHSFPSKEQVCFNFMLQSPSTVILEPKKIKFVTISTFFLFVYHEMMGPDTRISKPVFSLSSSILIKRFFSSSSFSHIRSAYSTCLMLLIFLLAVLIPACDSSRVVFHVMYSAYEVNEQEGQNAALTYSFLNFEQLCCSTSTSNCPYLHADSSANL